MHMKRTIRTWSDKFKNSFKSTDQFQILDIFIELIQWVTVDEKEIFLKVFMLTLMLL